MGVGGRHIQTRPRKSVVSAQAGWVGVRDMLEGLPVHDAQFAYVMKNVYPRDPLAGGGIVSRPGFLLTNSGQVAAAEVQEIGQFTKLDGTQITYSLIGGQIYTYDWGTDAWSVVVTTANFSTASVTTATTGRVYSTIFNDEVVFSDGTNDPWTWDGTSGAGGLTALTNAPVAYGKPCVYYAKLFFITAANQTEIMWSEENQANTGYDQGGYNNAWQLGQTASEPLYCLWPTNEVLYYTRRNSIGGVGGRVTPEFQTTGVAEAVSETVGCVSPDGFDIVGNVVHFVDSDGRPQALQVGGGLVEPAPWRGARTFVKGVSLDQLERVQTWYLCDTELVMSGVPTEGNDEINATMNVGAKTAAFCGYFNGWTAKVFAPVTDGNSCDRMMHGTSDGYIYLHQQSTTTDPKDQDTAGDDVAIMCEFESAPFFYDAHNSKIIDRVDAVFITYGFNNVSLSFVTERGEFGTGLTISDSNSVGSVWDTAVWDSDTWAGSAEGSELRSVMGTDQYCRWAIVRLTHEEVGGRWGISALAVEAFPEGDDALWP